MFKKIMVCLDGSKLAEQVIPYIASIAKMNDAEIILFKAISEPPTMSPNIPGSSGIPVQPTNIKSKLNKNLKESRDYLETLIRLLEEEGNLRIQTVTDFGSAGESIVNYANDNHVDLITIATHGHSGLERALFGSTADYVLRNSGLPNLIIRSKSEIQEESGESSRHLLKKILV
jgi:nucleotide-binding universal stress UspA family protein